MVEDSVAYRRRALLRQALAWSAGIAAPALKAKAGTEVVVVTNHNDDLVGPVVEAFERAHPHLRVHIEWLMPAEALSAFRQNALAADVWWEAAPTNHLAEFADRAMLLPLDPAHDAQPRQLLDLTLVHAERLYCATQLSLMPILLRADTLRQQQLPVPQDWTALASPRFAGQIALADPRRTRFSSRLVEGLLRHYGWADGWALVSAITANSQIGPSPVAERVASGTYAVGLEVDISPNADQRVRPPVQWLYPASGILLSAGYCGVLRQAAHPAGGRVFCSFLTGPTAQGPHQQTRSPRTRVIPAAALAAGTAPPFDAFEAERAQTLVSAASTDAGRQRLLLALWSVWIDGHAQHAALWARAHRAGPRYPAESAAALRALSEPLVSQAQADAWTGAGIFRPVENPSPRIAPGERAENIWLNTDPGRQRLSPQAQTLSSALAATMRARWAACDALLQPCAC